MPDAKTKTKTKSNSHEDDLFKIEYPEDSFAIQRDILQVRLTGAIEAVFDADDRIETFPVKKHSRWKPKDLERFVDLAYDLGAYEWEPEARKPFIKALADLRRRLGPAPKALPEVDRLIDMAEIFEDDDLLSAALDPSNEIWRRGDEEAFLRCMRVFRAVLHQLIRYEITGPKLKPIRPDHRALPTKALAAIGRSRAGWTNLRGHRQHWIPRRDRDVLVTQGLPVFLDKFSEQMGIKPLRFPFEVALPVKSGLLALSKDSPTPVSALLTTLFFESVVCAGASTDLGDPFAVFTELWPQDWLFTHILFMPVDAYPELEAECEAQRLGRETLGDNFRIIVPIPLYKEEAAWILDHGRRAFFESPNRPSPVFDPDRPNPLANYLKTSSPLRLADEKPLLPERLAALRVGVQRKVIEENAPVAVLGTPREPYDHLLFALPDGISFHEAADLDGLVQITRNQLANLRPELIPLLKSADIRRHVYARGADGGYLPLTDEILLSPERWEEVLGHLAPPVRAAAVVMGAPFADAFAVAGAHPDTTYFRDFGRYVAALRALPYRGGSGTTEPDQPANTKES